MEKLYFCVGYLFTWYCIAKVAILLAEVLGKLAKQALTSWFAFHAFGAYAFGYNLIWRADYLFRGRRYNMIRQAFRSGFKVRRWWRFVIATR